MERPQEVTKFINMRVTPELYKKLEIKAQELMLKPTEVARSILAQALLRPSADQAQQAGA